MWRADQIWPPLGCSISGSLEFEVGASELGRQFLSGNCLDALASSLFLSEQWQRNGMRVVLTGGTTSCRLGIRLYELISPNVLFM